jgi:hypothetical protein
MTLKSLPFLPLLLACAGGPGGWPVESGEVTSVGGAESVVSPRDAGVEAADLAGAAPVGSPCAANPDCATDFCMTTDNIGTFIKGAVVSNGYCSALFCAVDGSDGACSAAMGGTCFSLFPFLGDAFGDQGICLAPCTQDPDCRTADDNVCFDAKSLVDAGLMAASVLDQFYAAGTRGCLPRSVADAAVKKLRNP